MRADSVWARPCTASIHPHWRQMPARCRGCSVYPSCATHSCRRLSIPVAVLQHMGMARVAVHRCGVQPPSHPGRDSLLLDADPGCCLDSLARLLDWPFYMVAPDVMVAEGAPPARASCLAAALWMQLVAGVVLPVALLRGGNGALGGRQEAGAAAEVHAEAAGAGAGERGAQMLSSWRAWLDALLDEAPIASCVAAAELMWMLLRTACALRLPS